MQITEDLGGIVIGSPAEASSNLQTLAALGQDIITISSTDLSSPGGSVLKVYIELLDPGRMSKGIS
jgi:hypothetical protein